MSAGDLQLACASLLVDELVRRGLEHACLSPGSRSTPIALALARHPGVQLHVHLDERAAGFFALGIAKATGRPAAVACTSGTAAAELFPAVVEASMARVPLVVLTADRPPELRGTGANQTIDQIELYGDYPREFVQMEVAEPGEGLGREWRSVGARAAATALGPPAGPVHLNLPFREPLAPTGADAGLEDAEPWDVLPFEAPPLDAGDVDALVEEVRGVERGVVLAGGLEEPAKGVVALARTVGWPLLAEPTSGLRRPGDALAAGQALLACAPFAAGHVPDVVLQAGGMPTTRASQGFAASARRLVVIDPHGLRPSPERPPARTLRADPDALCAAAASRTGAGTGSRWISAWREADDAARQAIDAAVDAWDEPFEGRIARDVAAWVPDGSTLVVGSSMPIRDLDVFMAPRRGLRVLSNRGASGIDGVVSTALGVAATEPGRPTFALLGDLSLLHDVGSILWSGRRRDLDCVLVVPNNDGGVVFSFLPQRELPEHEALFVTPHGLDLGAVAAGAGVGHERVDRAADLLPAVERATAGDGVRIVEVAVDRELNVARHGEVETRLAEALDRGG